MKDRSDDPSHHERTLLPELQLAPLNDLENQLINFNCTGVVPTIDEQNNFLEIGMHLLCLSYTVCHFQTSYNKIYFQTLNWISLGAGRSSEVERSLMVRWVVGSILHGVDPLSYFSFQPVLHDWCSKGRGMCYPVCGMVHIKEPLLLIDKSSLCGGSGFPFSLSEWSLTICLTPYNRR